MAERIEYEPNIGPALALLGAVKDGNLATIHSAVEIAGAQQLTDSCTELVRRMIINAGLHVETNDLAVVYNWVTDERNAWQPIIIRPIDRFSWSQARRLGVYFASTTVKHYVEHGPTEDEWESGEFAVPIGVRLQVGRMRPKTELAWALGLAYGMSVIAEAIADYEDADIDERIKAYRAWAATEMLAPKP